MEIPTDPKSLASAILTLEARAHAQKMMIAVLVMDNPAALKALKAYAPLAEDVISSMLLTDEQIAIYRAEVDGLTDTVEEVVAFLKSHPSSKGDASPQS